jgi:PhoPQ-activated pathogenicity-related protein
MATTRYQSLFLIVLTAFVFVATPRSHATNALELYVQQPDQTFAWEIETQTTIDHFTITHVKMKSQTWRGHVWIHDLKIVSPQRLRHPEIALLFITGDNSRTSSAPTLQTLADRAGAVVAEVTRVPNQPLYDGRMEDALIAYTFDQYLRTGDETWASVVPNDKVCCPCHGYGAGMG